MEKVVVSSVEDGADRTRTRVRKADRGMVMVKVRVREVEDHRSNGTFVAQGERVLHALFPKLRGSGETHWWGLVGVLA